MSENIALNLIWSIDDQSYHESFTSISNTANFSHLSSPSPPFSFTFSTSIFCTYSENKSIHSIKTSLKHWSCQLEDYISRLKEIERFFACHSEINDHIIVYFGSSVQIYCYYIVVLLWQKKYIALFFANSVHL